MYESGWEPILPRTLWMLLNAFWMALSAKRRPQAAPTPPTHGWYTFFVPPGPRERSVCGGEDDDIAADL
jgi:hypothetical protein